MEENAAAGKQRRLCAKLEKSGATCYNQLRIYARI